MDYQLVDIKCISAQCRTWTDLEQLRITQLTESIIDCQCLVSPLIVRQKSVLEFELVSGSIRFEAVKNARDIDPRTFEMVGCMVIGNKDNIEKILKQLV